MQPRPWLPNRILAAATGGGVGGVGWLPSPAPLTGSSSSRLESSLGPLREGSDRFKLEWPRRTRSQPVSTSWVAISAPAKACSSKPVLAVSPPAISPVVSTAPRAAADIEAQALCKCAVLAGVTVIGHPRKEPASPSFENLCKSKCSSTAHTKDC